MNQLDYITEFYPRPAHEVRFCAICHSKISFTGYVESTLTNSVYVLNCSTPEQALQKAELFFKEMASTAKLCQTIHRIEILPENAGRWSNIPPALVKDY